jgi:hypothetical protein
MASRKKKQINTVVVISDSHFGCKLAIMHPDGAETDEGNVVLPSKLQRKVWDVWEEFWGEQVPIMTQGEPYIVVHNGDVIDGVHHNSTTQWTHNLEYQRRHAVKVLKPVVDACEGRYFQIRGTEAHVGRSGTDEETLAKTLGAVPNDQGNHARYELWLRLGGRLIHFLHHIGTTSSSAHEASAVNAELTAHYMEAARWHEEPPSVIVRSHRHRFIKVELAAYDPLSPGRGRAVALVTPCWQLKTSYAWKIAGARVTQPQLGGIVIRAGKEEMYTREFVVPIGRSPEVSFDA